MEQTGVMAEVGGPSWGLTTAKGRNLHSIPTLKNQAFSGFRVCTNYSVNPHTLSISSDPGILLGVGPQNDKIGSELKDPVLVLYLCSYEGYR